MKADKCLKNVRCDCGGCKDFAEITIDTNGYKGSICLCKKCLDSLSKDINKLKKDSTTLSKNKKDNK